MTTSPTPAAASTRRAPFPHHYEVTLSTHPEGERLNAPPRPTLVGGPPDTFGGRPEWWSPEHLLLASAALCLKTTFDALCAKQSLTVESYSTRAEGVLDKTPAGLAFTAIRLNVELVVAAGRAEAAIQIMESAKHWCIVSNSLKPAVEVELTVART